MNKTNHPAATTPPGLLEGIMMANKNEPLKLAGEIKKNMLDEFVVLMGNAENGLIETVVVNAGHLERYRAADFFGDGVTKIEEKCRFRAVLISGGLVYIPECMKPGRKFRGV